MTNGKIGDIIFTVNGAWLAIYHTSKSKTIFTHDRKERPMLYQICVLNKATESKKATVKHTALVEADNIIKATEQAEGKYDRASFRVYPYCTAQDGEGQMELARHTLRSVEHWERRNNNAVLEPFKRTPEDREDFIMCACVAFAVIFANNPSADMHTLKTAAFSAIRAEQARRDRNSEREYLPGWSACNITPRTAKATFPALDRLIRRAVSEVELTDIQIRILDMSYNDGQTAQDIADALNIGRTAVYRALYRAYYKILLRMVEIDRDLRTFTEAGYTAEDIDEVMNILYKRAK